MEVLASLYLSRGLSYPATLLIDTIIYLHEIDAGQIGGVAVFIYRPIDVNGRVIVHIGLVVHIPILVAVENEIYPGTYIGIKFAFIHTIFGKSYPLNVILSSLIQPG